MTDDSLSLRGRLTRSIKGHVKVALIALVFGLTAYGMVHILMWIIRTVEKM
ncbi:MAG: hypothetical protein GXP00_12625 [Alphaproteobacteria bacterium]|nr:hypothetical protein [Alphaproteobacteria bacterium]